MDRRRGESARAEVLPDRRDVDPGNQPDALGRAGGAVRQCVRSATETLPGNRQLPLDWAFIDGGHEYEELVRDLEGTLPVLAAGAYVLFHDAHFERVERGLNDMFVKYPSLTDLGMLATPRIEDCHNPGLYWGGIRAARYLPRAG